MDKVCRAELTQELAAAMPTTSWTAVAASALSTGLKMPTILKYLNFCFLFCFVNRDTCRDAVYLGGLPGSPWASCTPCNNDRNVKPLEVAECPSGSSNLIWLANGLLAAGTLLSKEIDPEDFLHRASGGSFLTIWTSEIEWTVLSSEDIKKKNWHQFFLPQLKLLICVRKNSYNKTLIFHFDLTIVTLCQFV